MQLQREGFGIADYLVLAASQALCLAVGFYYGRKGLTHGTMEEFALAGRKIAFLPAAMSIFATCYSGFGMTAMVGEMYMYGLGYLIFNVFYGFGGFFVAFTIVPVFFKIPYVSVYEYIEKRFNKTLRITYAVIYILQQTFYVSVIMYVPAISLAVITNLPYWISLLTFSVLCVAYSSVGGMKAVIWTDVLQTVLMVCCVFSIVIKGVLDAGGPSRVWEVGLSGKRIGGLYLEESFANRYSVWAMMIGGFLNGLNYLGTSQAGVQRILSVKNSVQGRRSLIIGASCFIIFSILTAASAVVIYVNYYNCDPTLNSEATGVKTEDQIVVYYISTVLSKYPGLAGLATAGIFSGSLSSLSSYINSFATITLQDLIIPNTSRKIGKKTQIILCRLLTVAYGVICTSIALVVPYIGRATPVLITVFGVFGGPLTGVFMMGIFVKRVNTKSALIGLLLSLIFGIWISVGSKLNKVPSKKLDLSVEGCTGFNESYVDHLSAFNYYTNGTKEFFSGSEENDVFPLYDISFAWYYPIGFFMTIIIAVAVSYVTKKDKLIDDSLFSHFVVGESVIAKTNVDEHQVFLLRNQNKATLTPEKKI